MNTATEQTAATAIADTATMKPAKTLNTLIIISTMQSICHNARIYRVEEYKKQKELSYENVVAYLQKAIQLKPKPLILTLIQKIVVYDDRLEIFFNYTKENNPDDTSRQDYLLPKCSTCYGMVEMFLPNPNLIPR